MSRGTRAAAALAAGVWATGLLTPPGVIAAQPSPADPPRAAASVHPDTVRVGEPFLLGVIARADPQAALVFPVRLELSEELEQVGPVEVRAEAGEGTWRAYYRLVGWRPGPHELPPVRIAWRAAVAGGGSAGAGGQERAFRVPTPGVVVASVLPAAQQSPDLRGPRPFLRYPSNPWGWIVAGLLLLLAVAVAAFWWRSRERPAAEAPPRPVVPPAERAVRSLLALRARWLAGEVEGAEFFDAWEGIVRAYVEATRGWPVGAPLRALADGYRPLAIALERSTLVRFARLEAEREVPSRAAAAAIDWIRAEESVEGPP